VETGSATRTVRVDADQLRDLLERIFRAAGCDDENARITADGVIEADLRGHHIQGTDHIYSILAELKAGRINGRARPRVARETAAMAEVDGDGAPGHVGALFAVDLAIRKAKAVGVAAVGLVRAADIFMLGRYVERMARAGLAGMTFTNSVPTRVHPEGGIDPLIGTNPIGFGFPVADAEPVIIDFATSASAVGHIRLASYGDDAIAEGIALDEDGHPTTSARDALAGSLTPLGGHKGFGLALAGAFLSGPIIGALIGEPLRAAAKIAGEAPRRGHLFIAIDPGAFGDSATSLALIRDHLDEIKSSRKAPGIPEIIIPGERSLRRRQESLVSGVELPERVWEHTLQIARDLGVDGSGVATLDAAPGSDPE
jgi:LDH2 family malate/lactate/ureidoglycolate dehydrogenase